MVVISDYTRKMKKRVVRIVGFLIIAVLIVIISILLFQIFSSKKVNVSQGTGEESSGSVF